MLIPPRTRGKGRGGWEVRREACSRRERKKAMGFTADFWEELSTFVKI